jgi:uncharacterized protein (DUF2062 family)
MLTPDGKSGTATLGIGAALIAIACCAGLPAIGALVGGVTLGAVVGFGLGAVALGVIAWTATAIVTRRRRDRCEKRSQDR